MNESIGIICDSTSSFSKQYIDDNNIEIVHLNVLIEGKSFVDAKEIENEAVFNAMDEGKKVTTSQPSPEQFLTAMNEMSKKHSKIICFVMSSGLSGTYNSARIAKDMYEGTSEIEIIDTRTSAMGIRACVEEFLSTKNVQFQKRVQDLQTFISNSKTFLTIDDLQTLVNHGRMRASQAMIGNILKIKPLLTLDGEGKVEVFKKIRTHKKLLAYMKDLVEESKSSKIYLTYVGKKENAIEFSNLITDKLKGVEVVLCEEVGPVLAVSLGKGGIGIFLPKNAV